MSLSTKCSNTLVDVISSNKVIRRRRERKEKRRRSKGKNKVRNDEWMKERRKRNRKGTVDGRKIKQ